MKTILNFIALGNLLMVLSAAEPHVRYTVIDLGTLGGTYSFGFGINTAGEIAGAAATPPKRMGWPRPPTCGPDTQVW
jgi:hypothetical protein